MRPGLGDDGGVLYAPACLNGSQPNDATTAAWCWQQLTPDARPALRIPLCIVALQHKQNLVKHKFRVPCVFLMDGWRKEGFMGDLDWALYNQRRPTSDTHPTGFTQFPSNTNKPQRVGR